MRLFVHSLMQIAGNLADVLRIAVPLLALGAVNTVLTAAGLLDDLALGVGFGGVYLIFSIGAAVHWHRFILREARPISLVASPEGQYMWPYLGRSLLLGLIAAPLSIALLAGLGLYLGPLINMPFGYVVDEMFRPGPGMVPTILVTTTWVGWLMLRLSLGLAAIAVGKRIGLGQSWRISSAMNGQIFATALLLTGANFGASMLVAYMRLTPLTGFVGDLFGAAFYVLILFLSMSVVTTLYGHLVEKRALAA